MKGRSVSRSGRAPSFLVAIIPFIFHWPLAARVRVCAFVKTPRGIEGLGRDHLLGCMRLPKFTLVL